MVFGLLQTELNLYLERLLLLAFPPSLCAELLQRPISMNIFNTQDNLRAIEIGNLQLVIKELLLIPIQALINYRVLHLAQHFLIAQYITLNYNGVYNLGLYIVIKGISVRLPIADNTFIGTDNFSISQVQ